MYMSQDLSLSRQDGRRLFSLRRGGVLLTLSLGLLLELPGSGQNSMDRFSQTVQDASHHRTYDANFSGSMDISPIDVEKRLRALNADRQNKLVADTNKLLKLAAELNAELSNSNSGSLTSEEKRKVGEIEKLARSVKNKMSTSVRGAQDLMGSPWSAEYR